MVLFIFAVIKFFVYLLVSLLLAFAVVGVLSTWQKTQRLATGTVGRRESIWEVGGQTLAAWVTRQ